MSRRDAPTDGKPGWLARFEERQQAKFDSQFGGRSSPVRRYDDAGAPLGPFLDYPGSEFRYERDGEFGTGQVDVDRVWTPIWANVMTRRSLSGGIGGGLAAFLIAVLVRGPVIVWHWVRHRQDRRWRLAVLHARRTFPSNLRPVLIEFFHTEAEADARRMEILTTWDDVDWFSRPVIGLRERRRLRDEPPQAL